MADLSDYNYGRPVFYAVFADDYMYQRTQLNCYRNSSISARDISSSAYNLLCISLYPPLFPSGVIC